MGNPNMLHVPGEPAGTHNEVTDMPHGSDIPAGVSEALRLVCNLTPQQVESLDQMAGIRPPFADNK